MARNNKNKRKAQAMESSTEDRLPKINPQLAREVGGIVTKSLTFRCLCDNLDVFEVESYKDCSIVQESFGASYKDLFNTLQTRESSKHYHEQPDLENAASGFLATKNAPIPDGRKSTAILQAMRPYLLFDKWITVMRKNPADRSKRPVIRSSDLPGFKTPGTKPKPGAEDESGNKKDRAAFFSCNSFTLKTINPPLEFEGSRTHGVEGLQMGAAPPMTDENIWSRLVRYGVNSKKFKKIGVAQYRLATIAVVVNFFIQGFFSDSSVYDKAAKLFAAQGAVDIGSAEDDWMDMLEDGLQWLDMAVATTLKDAMVFSRSLAPTAPCLLEIGIRCRQGPEDPEFEKLENGLWKFLFDLALLKTEKTLTSHIWSIGKISGAERPEERNLSVVLFTTPPIAPPSKRRIESTPPDELSRPTKRARTTDENPNADDDHRNAMDQDAAVGTEDPKTTSPGVQQPPDQTLVVEEHGPDTNPCSEGLADAACSEREFPGSQPQCLPQNSEEQVSGPNQEGFPPGEDKDTVEVGGPGTLQDAVGSSPNQDGSPPVKEKNLVEVGGPEARPDAVGTPPSLTTLDTSSVQRLPPFPSHLGFAEGPESVSAQSDTLPDSSGDGSGTARPKTAGKKQVSFDEQERTDEGPRYPQRDRRLSSKAQLFEQSGQATNETFGRKRAKRTKRREKKEGEDEATQGADVKEEDDYYDRIFSIAKNAGYKFIDVEREVIDVDALYEGFAKNKSDPDVADATPASVPRNKTDKKAQKEQRVPDLERVDAPDNKKTVNMTVDGKSLMIHTWYDGDYTQLTAFKKTFEENGTRTKDMVSEQTAERFSELTASEVKDILAKKHLLVTGCEVLTSVEDMERRLLMKRETDIQDLYYRKDGDIDSHRNGTLQLMKDIINSELEDEQKRENERQRPMNALDLPCGQVPIEIPRLSEISFRDVAWSFLKHVDRPRFQESIPMDDFRWALYSSRNAYSTPHVDANGLCTAIAPVNCTKLWILGKPLKETLMDSRALQKFSMYDIDLNDYEWAPLLLKPGDILYMRPGTVHAVVTIEPGFTIGEHYHDWVNMEDSLASMFHLCAANSVLTNTSHNVAVMKTLVRLVKCWRYRLSSDVEEVNVPKLDFSKTTSIKCLAMIGTYLHVFPFVEDLERGLSPSDVEALGQATKDAQVLQNTFLQLFDLKNVAQGSYAFPEKDSDRDRRLDKSGTKGDEKEESWEKAMHNKIFRNGQLWIVAHLKVFFVHAKKLVDEKEKEKIATHAARLEKLIPELLKHAHLKQAWFNRLHRWVKDNFSTIRLDGWLDWDKLEIQPRASEDEEEGMEVDEVGNLEEEQAGDLEDEEQDVDVDP